MGDWKLGYHTDNTYAKVTNDGAIVINNPITEIEKDDSGNKYDSYNEFNSAVLDFFVQVLGGSGEASWGGISGNIEDQEDLSTALNSKVDKVAGKGLSTNDYTTAEKTKLSGIEDGANNYVHPTTHPASIITQTASARFVTDAEKADWNSKETPEGSQTKATKALTDAIAYVDGKVLTDVPLNAKFTDTVYAHPTSDGNLHVPATGTTNNGKVLKAGATAGSLAWGTDNDTITTINGKTGAITKADIVALGIPAQDTVYTHPEGTNPHGTTKADVGLGNVDNTSDANKPVSTAQQAALDAKIDSNKFQVVTELPLTPDEDTFYFIEA